MKLIRLGSSPCRQGLMIICQQSANDDHQPWRPVALFKIDKMQKKTLEKKQSYSSSWLLCPYGFCKHECSTNVQCRCFLIGFALGSGPNNETPAERSCSQEWQLQAEEQRNQRHLRATPSDENGGLAQSGKISWKFLRVCGCSKCRYCIYMQIHANTMSTKVSWQASCVTIARYQNLLW